MARLNTRPSATPLQSRATTVDALYRDPTPAGRASTARNSSYSVLSHALSQSSDKENDIPESRQNTPPPASKRGFMAGTRAQRLPTPDSAEPSNPNKRRRTTKYDSASSELRGVPPAGVSIYEDTQDGPEEDDDDDEEGYDDDANLEEEEEDANFDFEEDDVSAQALPTPTDAPEDDDDDPDMRYYNPQQDPRKRRQIRSNFRNLQRELEGNNLAIAVQTMTDPARQSR